MVGYSAYADEITWQDNTENGRIEKNSTDEEQPAEVNDWGGEDFVAKEEPSAETGEEDSASKGMSTEQAAAALAVAAAGDTAVAGKGLKGAKAAKKTKPRKSNGLVDAESKSGSKTGTVWDNITPTQENYPYTNISKRGLWRKDYSRKFGIYICSAKTSRTVASNKTCTV